MGRGWAEKEERGKEKESFLDHIHESKGEGNRRKVFMRKKKGGGCGICVCR